MDPNSAEHKISSDVIIINECILNEECWEFAAKEMTKTKMPSPYFTLSYLGLFVSLVLWGKLVQNHRSGSFSCSKIYIKKKSSGFVCTEEHHVNHEPCTCCSRLQYVPCYPSLLYAVVVCFLGIIGLNQRGDPIAPLRSLILFCAHCKRNAVKKADRSLSFLNIM